MRARGPARTLTPHALTPSRRKSLVSMPSSHRVSRPLALVVVLLLLAAPRARAQSPAQDAPSLSIPLPLDSVKDGARIRLSAPGIGGTGFSGSREGVLERRAGDTLLFARQQLLLRVPLSNVTLLEVWNGKEPNHGHAGVGAVIGMGVGLGLAQLMNAGSVHDPGAVTGATIGMGILGAGLGFVLGRSRPADVWRPVTLPAPAGR